MMVVFLFFSPPWLEWIEVLSTILIQLLLDDNEDKEELELELDHDEHDEEHDEGLQQT